MLTSFSDEPLTPSHLCFQDPRPAGPKSRAYCKKSDVPKDLNAFESYNQRRLQLGIPEGSWDMVPEKAIPLECGLDDLGAISWQKGCYLGQELTARTKHRGLVRKRFLPFKAPCLLLEQHKVLLQEGKKVGTILSHADHYGLTRLRLEALQNKAPITLEDQPVEITVPEWMKFSENV